MAIPFQAVFPGVLEDAYQTELQKFISDRTLARLWDHHSSLWPAEEHQAESIKQNLRWLDLPKQMEDYMARVVEHAEAARASGLDHVVFVGMGGSKPAAAALVNMQKPNVDKKIFVFDTTDPDALRALKAQLPIERTLFVFADKAGKRIEIHGLLLYFLDQFKSAGLASPGQHFVALTEKGSYLATLAGQYKFRKAFFEPGIHGRFSGLIHFSLFLTGVFRVDKASRRVSIAW